MPLDHGCWLDQHHGVEDLRPSSVKPHPEEPVCEEEPKPAFALTPEHGDLVPKGDKFKFQRDAAANTEREQGNESGKNGNHAHKRYGGGAKSPAFLSLSEF